MRSALYIITVIALLFGLAACGEDRSSLAKKTVQTYWQDIASGKTGQAYKLLTSGNRVHTDLKSYNADMLQFLTTTGGIKAKVGEPSVDDDHATVPVTLISPKSAQNLNAYQHLFWENGSWHISDNNGGLSRTK